MIYSKPLPVWQTRVEALKMAFRLYGAFPTPHEQERITLIRTQQNLYLVPQSKEEVPPVEIASEVEE